MKHLLFGFSFIFFLIQTSPSFPLGLFPSRAHSVAMSPCGHFSHDYNNTLYAHILMVNGRSPSPRKPHLIETEKFIIPTHEFYCFCGCFIFSVSSSYTFGLRFYLEWNGCGKKELNRKLPSVRMSHGKATERKGKMFGYELINDFVSSVYNSSNSFDLFVFHDNQEQHDRFSHCPRKNAVTTQSHYVICSFSIPI